MNENITTDKDTAASQRNTVPEGAAKSQEQAAQWADLGCAMTKRVHEALLEANAKVLRAGVEIGDEFEPFLSRVGRRGHAQTKMILCFVEDYQKHFADKGVQGSEVPIPPASTSA